MRNTAALMDTKGPPPGLLGITGRRVGRHGNENGTAEAPGKIKATNFRFKEVTLGRTTTGLGQTLGRTTTFLERVASPRWVLTAGQVLKHWTRHFSVSLGRCSTSSANLRVHVSLSFLCQHSTTT